MIKNYSLALVTGVVALVGCGSKETSTNSKTNPTQDMQFYGAKIALAESDLPKCDSTKIGQLFYVLKTEEFQFCTKEGYEVIDLSGADGSDGADGADGEPGLTGPKGATGAAGSSCSVESNTDGTKTITCTDKTTATLKDGEGCSVVDNLDGSYDLTCGDATVVIKNGEDGGTGKPGLDFLSGTVPPDQSLGKDGDTYLDVKSSVYYQKVDGLWSFLYGDTTLPEVCQTLGKCGVFNDKRDSKIHTYRWVKIGTGATAQVWMAENLNYYSTTSECLDENTGTTTSINTPYCDIYGRLYKFPDAQNSCPAGWHLPGDGEWKRLEMAIGMSSTDVDLLDFRGTSEGNKLKSTSDLWKHSIGTDEYGFSALPAGFSHNAGVYSIGDFAYFWTNTEDENTPDEAYVRGIPSSLGSIQRISYSQFDGHSVRCVLTETP